MTTVVIFLDRFVAESLSNIECPISGQKGHSAGGRVAERTAMPEMLSASAIGNCLAADTEEPLRVSRQQHRRRMSFLRGEIAYSSASERTGPGVALDRRHDRSRSRSPLGRAV